MSTLDVDSESGPTKPRRPDRAVYVPRALRAPDDDGRPADQRRPDAADDCRHPDQRRPDAADDGRPADQRRPDSTEDGRPADGKCPKSPAARDKSANGTPRHRPDKHFCNVYTPPHLRTRRPDAGPPADPLADPLADPPAGPPADPPADPLADPLADPPAGPPADPPADSATAFGDSGCNELDGSENFYIGDYFANGQLGFYRPSLYDYDSSYDDWSPDDVSMAAPDARRGDLIDGARPRAKDEDADASELERASREINRSGKRIIKQSFDSDVLVISEPGGGAPGPAGRAPGPTPRREDCDWEAVFDDSGECLDPSLLEELAATVGRVTVSAARRRYERYEAPPPREAGAREAGAGEAGAREAGEADAGAREAFAHVVEVYDFPGEFRTNDLLALFSEYKDTGFEIKWVDDTHALIVFSSARIAAEVLAAPRSLARCRPLHAATLESRAKAKKCAEFLRPYRQRPETCAALARRLVSGALGVRLSTASQERAEERRLITRAREKKRQAALHKEAAWDGSLANTTPEL